MNLDYIDSAAETSGVLFPLVATILFSPYFTPFLSIVQSLRRHRNKTLLRSHLKYLRMICAGSIICFAPGFIYSAESRGFGPLAILICGSLCFVAYVLFNSKPSSIHLYVPIIEEVDDPKALRPYIIYNLALYLFLSLNSIISFLAN